MTGGRLLSSELDRALATLTLPGDDVKAMGQVSKGRTLGGAEAAKEAAAAVVNAGAEGELREVVGAEMETCALRLVSQGVVKRAGEETVGLIRLVRIVRVVWIVRFVRIVGIVRVVGCHLSCFLYSPNTVVRSCVAFVAGVAEHSRAVVGTPSAEVGGVFRKAADEIEDTFTLRHEVPLLAHVERVAGGGVQLSSNQCGGGWLALGGVIEGIARGAVYDVEIAVGEREDAPLLAL